MEQRGLRRFFVLGDNSSSRRTKKSRTIMHCILCRPSLVVACCVAAWTMKMTASAFSVHPVSSAGRQNIVLARSALSSSSSLTTAGTSYASLFQTTTTTTTQLNLKRPNLLGGWKFSSRFHRDGPSPSASNRATVVGAPRNSGATEQEDQQQQQRDSDRDDERSSNNNNNSSRQGSMRQRIRELAVSMVRKPIQTATTLAPMPQAIATVLKDATMNAVDMAVDEGE
jgi:hypothetical protein